jgi:DHA2 family multidrug resistance protein
LFNLIKTIGFSFGVTVVTSLVYRGSQENWSRLVGFLDSTSPGYSFFLQQTDLDDGTAQTGAYLVQIIQAQSYMLTYSHVTEVLALLALAGIPLTYFMRTKVKPPAVPTEASLERTDAATA